MAIDISRRGVLQGAVAIGAFRYAARAHADTTQQAAVFYLAYLNTRYFPAQSLL